MKKYKGSQTRDMYYNGYSRYPKKGTGSRKALALMFREQGATMGEMIDGAGLACNSVRALISKLTAECGLDIMSVRKLRDDEDAVYMVVGQHTRSGGYRGFTRTITG